MVYRTLLTRRSARKFTSQKVEKDKIDKLIKSALLSPTSKNNRPWEFIVVDEPDLLQQLSQAKPHGSKFLSRAVLAIVVIADTNKSDVWIEDASIASMSILLTAEELGLGACWVQIRQRSHDNVISADEYVKTLLNIPPGYAVESIIGMGYPEEKKPPYNEQELLYDRVYANRFSNKLY